MPEVYVGIGSNVEPVPHLKLAVEQLQLHFGPLRCSEVFRSPAYGFSGDDFLNMVAAFESDAGPDSVERTVSAIEYAGGRRRQAARYVPRRLDIDLMLYGRFVDPALRLPRDDVLRFAFVLGPLAEIAPALIHPVTGVALGDAWRAMRARPGALTRLGRLGELG